MYYEEDFCNQPDFDDSDDMSGKVNSRRLNKAMGDMDDKRRHVIKCKSNRDIVVFSCGSTGSNIRNAVTGAYSNHLVGSAMEDLYYRVSCSVGTARKKLFFDSPGQYEKHFGCNVEKDVFNGSALKKLWADRVSLLDVKHVSNPSSVTTIH